MRIYATHEISPLLGRMLRKLSCFEGADIIFAAELTEGESGNSAYLQSIRDYAPTVLITRSSVIAREVLQYKYQPKIVLLHTHDHNTHEKFWLNAYYLDTFIMSTDKVFEIN